MSVAVGAVDFGASSVRVCRVTFGDGPPELEVVHRHAHAPVHDGTHLRWDWSRLVAEAERGLELATTAGPLASIGVDTWGVDYGLLDHRGELVDPPISYRDPRTDGYRSLLERIGEEHFFTTTGLQALQIDTIFQLAAHDRRAARACAPPPHAPRAPRPPPHGSGDRGALVGGHHRAARPRDPDVVGRARRRGRVRSVGARSPAPCGHAGREAGVGSRCTWSAATTPRPRCSPGRSTTLRSSPPARGCSSGANRTTPDTSAAAFAAGFANELGALGGVRLLRNVAGWWLVEECRRQWGDPDLDDLLTRAASIASVPVGDALDPRLLAPSDMATTLAELAGLPDPTDRAAITRCAVESMAASAAQVIASLPGLDDRRTRPRLRRRHSFDAAARRAGSSHRETRPGRPDRGRRAGQRARPSARPRRVRDARRCTCDTRRSPRARRAGGTE